ncbi:MAG: hypothetical protein LQ345_007387 [Seirophora villosa]|nr:MAG: hypothetical protein LQ345_007387 [Seirophora villosa]
MEIGTGKSDSASPTGPPYSPITPVMSNTMPSEGSQEAHHTFPAEPPLPPLEPFSESDNPDAIALRSAISILLIQRQQTLRDLKTLERQKRAAVADPEAFSSAVVQGRVKTQSKGVLDAQPDFAPSYIRDAGASNGQEESDTQTSQHSHSQAFDDIPGPQNVVRCPPINWAKYHIVGKPLDVLHEEQRKRPLSNQDYGNSPPKRAEEHKIAAPYNPWQDRLGTTTTRQPD